MDTWVWRWRHLGLWMAGAVGVVLAWLHAYDLVHALTDGVAAETMIAVGWVVLLSATIFGVCTIRMWMTIKKERYANITRQVHAVMHQLRDISTYIRMKEPRGDSKEAYKTFLDNCRLMFGNVLDQVTLIFTSLTSNNCRSAIKLLYPVGGELYVYTLTRDRAARQDCIKGDNDRVTSNHDPLSRNYQFARLANSNEDCWHFASQDLTREKSFRTTSASAYDPDWESDVNTKKRRWPLPYKSTITCVIRQGTFDFYQEHQSEVVGYLTIDCQSRRVFEFRWDVELCFAVADALYAPIQAYLAAQSRAASAPSGTRAAVPAT